MRVVIPSDTTLLTTNVPPDPAQEYNAATPYPKGAVVQIPSLHRLYESQIDANVDNWPPDNLNTKWIDLGAPNDYAMLDEFTNTATENPESITIKLAVDRIDHVVLMGVVGTTLELKLWSADQQRLLWSDSVNLVYTNRDVLAIRDWRGFFFHPPVRLYNDLYRRINVLSYSAVLEITISYPGNMAKCTKVVVGQGTDLGLTLWGVEVKIVDFSIVAEDRFGRTFLQQGASAKLNNLEVEIDNADFDAVVQYLNRVRGQACAWLNDNDAGYQSLLVYGYYRDMSVVLEGVTHSICRKQIVGLI